MSTPQPYAKPLPVPDADTRPFWEAAKQHKLSIQKCGACGKHVFYPRRYCNHCNSAAPLEWVEAKGTGTVYTYTVARRPASRAFEGDVPYVVALIDLDEGARMMSGIVGCPVEQVKIGMRVRVVFDDVTPDISLPKFTPE